MLTITVGSIAAQDTSWGGPHVLPVPTARSRRAAQARHGAAREGARAPASGAVSLVSLRLLGLVEITRTRELRRSP